MKLDRREIKFRAWDSNKKEMLYPDGGNYLTIYSNGGHIPWGIYDNQDHKRLLTGDPMAILNLPGILMQFTGFYDSHAKPIYDGDILRYKFLADKSEDDFMPVSFERGQWVVGNHSDKESLIEDLECDIFKITVAGNIFQNPDLLPPSESVKKE